MATDEEFFDSLLENEGEGGASGEGAAAEGTSVSDDWLTHIDDLFARADEQANEESLSSGVEENDESLDMFDENISFLNADFELADFENMDVTQIIDSMEKAGSDLEEINGLLKDVDQSISIPDSVASVGSAPVPEDVSLPESASLSDTASVPESVSLADSASVSGGASADKGTDAASLAMDLANSIDNSNVSSDDIFDIFAESMPEEEAQNKTSGEDGGAQEEEQKEKPSKKKKSKLFGKGKKSKKDGEEDIAITDVGSAGTDELLDALPGAEPEDGKKAKEKKPGLFTRMMTYLTEEEEEPLSDENAAILKELDEEDKQKSKKGKKKKEKKPKKDKKGKKAQEGDELAEGEEGAEEEEKSKKKKKKEKKEKKEKAPNEESNEKPVKALSRKNMLLIVAFCATLTTCLVTLSTFLPEYSDRKNARDAFYAGDYQTAYTLLYNKRLDSNDTVIFNRVKIVLKFEKRLKSYENNIALGRELEAVHALMQGVADYQNPEGADEYGARNEIDAIYQQICSILENEYGITPEEAIEINAYESIEYTKKLNSVVNGTDYTAPGEEKEEEPAMPQDILPDEEEIITY